METTQALVIGAGQAGLSVSHELKERGVAHIVLERANIGEGWHRRWDSFCLVTPNWTAQLPGFPYDGDDPDGFMPRDDIVAYLQRYAASFDAPVREGVDVTSVTRDENGFRLETSGGEMGAPALIMATGAFQRPHRPAAAASLPARLNVIDLTGYHNPDALPPGDVLIVGSGQSGCQIAEELHEAGRRVVLSCGRAPWMPRRFGDHDLTWWLFKSGFVDVRVETLPEPARLLANVLASGHEGGHDLHLRTLQKLGVTLTGHFTGADATVAHFADDLAASVAWGDGKYGELREVFNDFAKRLDMPEPELPDPPPFEVTAPTSIELSSFGTVLFTGGFRPDFTSLLPWPDAFDDHGFPHQLDGSSTVVEGLHFVGLHFLRTRKSALLFGVGEDAGVVAATVAGAQDGAA